MKGMNALEAYAAAVQYDREGEQNFRVFTICGECSNCGSCCTNLLPVSGKEKKTIRRYIQKHGIKEQTCHYPTADPILDLTCPFRHHTEKKCLIYEVRPAICRAFRCDNPMEKIKADRALFNHKYGLINMREEFYGGKTE